jgi:hypothetical protein
VWQARNTYYPLRFQGSGRFDSRRNIEDGLIDLIEPVCGKSETRYLQTYTAT